jgi:RND family efflux transporter MFP subunit
VVELPMKEGDRFEKGALLLAFDCEKYKADYRGAEAELKTHQITLDNGAALLKRGALGAFEQEINRTRVDKAKAAVDLIATRIAECRIEAPFSGRIAEMRIRRFETTSANVALLRIVGDRALEVDLIVPSSWLAWLEARTEFSVKIDETGEMFAAVVSRLPATVDAVSQTAKLTGTILTPKPSLLPGMSVTATFRRIGG